MSAAGPTVYRSCLTFSGVSLWCCFSIRSSAPGRRSCLWPSPACFPTSSTSPELDGQETDDSQYFNTGTIKTGSKDKKKAQQSGLSTSVAVFVCQRLGSDDGPTATAPPTGPTAASALHSFMSRRGQPQKEPCGSRRRYATLHHLRGDQRHLDQREGKHSCCLIRFFAVLSSFLFVSPRSTTSFTHSSKRGTMRSPSSL